MASVMSEFGSENLPTRYSRAWWRDILRSRYVIGGAYALAVILTVTGVALASSPPKNGPISAASTAILVVLGFNLALIIAIATVVGLRLFEMIDARANDAGARLHLRFVGLFSLAAVAPAVIVALFFRCAGQSRRRGLVQPARADRGRKLGHRGAVLRL
jgi:two-component system nitrogen regulation sensor histidine kinase NtrY